MPEPTPTPLVSVPQNPSPPPAKKTVVSLTLPSGRVIQVTDDPYSNRLRCDHPPPAADGSALATALVAEARARGRARVVVFAPPEVASAMVAESFEPEAVIPGFYNGETDCVVLAEFETPKASRTANPIQVAEVDAVLAKRRKPKPRPDVETFRAGPKDAARVAALLDETFKDYPTPSHDPVYVRAQIEEGTPFRYVEEDGVMVACASADLIPDAQTAELTDCATKPSARGKGYMRAILGDLVEDLEGMGYASAFTLARARIKGVNIAFQRLGFQQCGRMTRSCRIGEGIEDMNVWSRLLRTEASPEQH